jgi:phosphoglycolate phosphatase
MIQAVFFDLDGTFADTAPDLAYAMNMMRAARDLPPVPLEATRPVTSHGARGLLGVGFGIAPDHADYHAMRAEFLGYYAANLCRETRLFTGMHELIEAFDVKGIRWGIVTNKAERLARPLIDALQLGARCACVIGGDTVGRMKPHPDPLLKACERIGVRPEHCAYVGDDRRDIEAARAARMVSIAVRYGYLNGGDPETWEADFVVDRPQDVLRHVERAGTFPRPCPPMSSP